LGDDTYLEGMQEQQTYSCNSLFLAPAKLYIIYAMEVTDPERNAENVYSPSCLAIYLFDAFSYQI
jgi:hypothetical protein